MTGRQPNSTKQIRQIQPLHDESEILAWLDNTNLSDAGTQAKALKWMINEKCSIVEYKVDLFGVYGQGCTLVKQ